MEETHFFSTNERFGKQTTRVQKAFPVCVLRAACLKLMVIFAFDNGDGQLHDSQC